VELIGAARKRLLEHGLGEVPELARWPMDRPERLTIDVTVARDFRCAGRERHAYAEALFELARKGDVELVTAPQGYRLDVSGDLAGQLSRAFAEENVAEANQLAYLSEATYPSESLVPGAYVAGFNEAWQRSPRPGRIRTGGRRGSRTASTSKLTSTRGATSS
jgi:hypothetical protein